MAIFKEDVLFGKDKKTFKLGGKSYALMLVGQSLARMNIVMHVLMRDYPDNFKKSFGLKEGNLSSGWSIGVRARLEKGKFLLICRNPEDTLELKDKTAYTLVTETLEFMEIVKGLIEP